MSFSITEQGLVLIVQRVTFSTIWGTWGSQARRVGVSDHLTSWKIIVYYSCQKWTFFSTVMLTVAQSLGAKVPDICRPGHYNPFESFLPSQLCSREGKERDPRAQSSPSAPRGIPRDQCIVWSPLLSVFEKAAWLSEHLVGQCTAPGRACALLAEMQPLLGWNIGRASGASLSCAAVWGGG